MRCRRLLAALAVAGLIASLAGGLDRAGAQAPETVVIAQAEDIGTADPQTTVSIHASNVLINIYDTLIYRDAELRLKPGLALSWRLVEPLVWELTLRRGVRFHNGEPFNAEAVKFSFDRFQRDPRKFRVASFFRPVRTVTVVDEFTIRFTTDRPWPAFPATVGRYGFIVPPRYVTERGDDALVRQPVGTGPYRFVRWVKDDRIELEANPNYWGGRPRIPRVTVRIIPAESSRLAELLSGSVHLINLVPPEIFGPIQRSPRARLVSARSASIYYILLNLVNIPNDRPLADRRVRQALNLAVDRQHHARGR